MSMVLWKKIAIGAAAVLVLVGLGVVGFFYALVTAFGDMCGNSPIAEYPSPDGRLKAVVFERNCGATTGFSTQVSILRPNSELENEGGNLFVADTGNGRAPAGIDGGPEVRVRWLSNALVEVQYHPDVRISRASKKVYGAEVAYVPFEAKR
jgi:hypothetical protein